MGKSNREMLDAIRQAMQAEADGHQFYRLAAGKTEDEQAGKVFRMLADEELEHIRFLKRNYDSILSTGKTDEAALPDGKGEFSGEHPLFSPDFKERIAGAHFEMSALGIGIQLELSAIRFYREQAQLADDQNLKRLFGDLADWEVGHYEMFLKQREELKELYWDAGGFSPF